MPLAPLLIPTLVFYGMEKKQLIPKNRAAKLFLELSTFAAALTYAPALGCALFPQVAKTTADEVE